MPSDSLCRRRGLLSLALSYFFFMMSLNVFSIMYNYLDLRYHWRPLRISVFFASYNALFALAAGIGTQYIVPKRLTEEQGALFGLSLQVNLVLSQELCSVDKLNCKEPSERTAAHSPQTAASRESW